MMKAWFAKMTFLALLAGITLSANAKTTQTGLENITLKGQGNDLTVAVRGFAAGQVIKKDLPISCATPNGGS